MILTNAERKLLNNVLESLDRLFDREIAPDALAYLLETAATSLERAELAIPFEDPIRRLADMLRSDVLPDAAHDAALQATDGLHHFIAAQLLADTKENPKRRHVVLRAGVQQGSPAGK